jgi:hypothetical protein
MLYTTYLYPFRILPKIHQFTNYLDIAPKTDSGNF